MNRKAVSVVLLSFLFPLLSLAGERADLAALRDSIERRISGVDARIGVAVITSGGDTLEVNGAEAFPMLSVYKFPQALAVADWCEARGILPSDTISVEPSDLPENTWSPMRDKYGTAGMEITLAELLGYSVGQSDNNACDRLFRLIGGPAVADSLMRAIGHPETVIASTEDEMHRDLALCDINCTTPLGMARLFDEFYRGGLCGRNPVSREVAGIMLDCRTGLSRLPAGLAGSEASIAHKTGTGDIDSRGRIIAVNDAGFVSLPSGDSYAIAVFVSGSACGMEQTEAVIADISRIVFKALGEAPCRNPCPASRRRCGAL